MAGVAEKLNFSFYFTLIHLILNVSGPVWLLATILDDEVNRCIRNIQLPRNVLMSVFFFSSNLTIEGEKA